MQESVRFGYKHEKSNSCVDKTCICVYTDCYVDLSTAVGANLEIGVIGPIKPLIQGSVDSAGNSKMYFLGHCYVHLYKDVSDG